MLHNMYIIIINSNYCYVTCVLLLQHEGNSYDICLSKLLCVEYM